MKTKIAALLMIIAFFATSVAFADENPNSKAENYHPGYLGPPIEVPNHQLIDLDTQIRKYIIELFDLPWESPFAKQDFIPDVPDQN